MSIYHITEALKKKKYNKKNSEQRSRTETIEIIM